MTQGLKVPNWYLRINHLRAIDECMYLFSDANKTQRVNTNLKVQKVIEEKLDVSKPIIIQVYNTVTNNTLRLLLYLVAQKMQAFNTKK